MSNKLPQALRAVALATAALLGQATQAVQAAESAEPIWDGNKVRMVAETLAPGAHAFFAENARELNAKGGAAATSSGLIVGTKAALLIDTMLNKRLNAQVQALGRKGGGIGLATMCAGGGMAGAVVIEV